MSIITIFVHLFAIGKYFDFVVRLYKTFFFIGNLLIGFPVYFIGFIFNTN